MQIIGTIKQSVKQHRFSENLMTRIGVLVLFILGKLLRTAKRVCVDPEFRAVFFLQLLHVKNVHQTTPVTSMDRYPEIFSVCRQYFEDKQGIKILSYGCSTGEEVLTLRQYFPHADIIGAEINKHSLARCRKLPVDNKITFIYSTYNEIEKQGLFDAIFCMAVLQRNPHYIAANDINSLKDIYPFEKFERQIVEFDRLIKPQGLLIVHFTQYSLWDTAVASKYRALGIYQTDYISPVFDKNSMLVNKPDPQYSIFIKLSEQ